MAKKTKGTSSIFLDEKCRKKMPMAFISEAVDGVLYLDGMVVSFRIWTGYFRFFQSAITIASRLPVQGQYC